jgi:predicted O-linked N-acetylglucosamine transferase (SPINDLY family)
VALNLTLAEAWICRGNVLIELKRANEASAAYDRALALNPTLALAWLGRGNASIDLKRHGDALAAFDKALAGAPDLAEAWLGRGNVFFELKQSSDALASYDKALALDPNLARAWLARGNAFVELQRYEEAHAAFDRAINAEPDMDYALGNRLFAKLMICDWTNLEAQISDIFHAIRAEKRVMAPFPILCIPSTPADQLACAKRNLADQTSPSMLWRGEIYAHDRIRIAYLSADLHDHATAHLMAGLFEMHDKSRFETTAVSFGPEDGSDLRRRLKNSFEHFLDVRADSDQAVAELVRQREIDIAVDLKGFSQNARPGIFARRAAPVQVNYLGYPGTMGADYFDYIVADETIIPDDRRQFYSEQVVWLPDSYQANDSHRQIAAATPTREQCGLPGTGFVFCCFNNTIKITPEMFDIWMRLLTAVDGSVLWLIDGNATASANLHREAERRGVSAARLIFAPRVALAEHLARHRNADLFLDIVPCNAHTTASDALWAGVPVLTCLGRTFAGRVAASLLKAAGLPELVATSLEQYEAMALALAREPGRLASMKEKLARDRGTCPLFNTRRFTRHIEAAYVTMWEQSQRGQGPSGFAVRAIE